MKLHGGPHHGTRVQSTRDELILYADQLFTWRGNRDYAIYRLVGRRYVFQGIENRHERRRPGAGRAMASYHDGLEIPGA